MGGMFHGAYAFNQDISDWDVSSVTNMNGMFNSASAFNQDISGWDVSSVTDIEKMFDGAYAFNQDISDWDVSLAMDTMEWLCCSAQLLGKRMKTKEAIFHVLQETKVSKYRLAMQLGVRPIMINHYIRSVKPCKMSKLTADKFEDIFDIKIIDMYNPIKGMTHGTNDTSNETK